MKRSRVAAHAVVPPAAAADGEALHRFHESQYFGAYADLSVHVEMLRDGRRTLAYKAALEAADLRGKTVLDVGCGTGVLSVFAARAGAARVFAVEASDLAQHTRRVVEDNGLSHVITVIQSRVEDVALPDGCTSVDVIVSEWMGYALFYENMLPCVLAARDRWLAPGGVMLPSHATLWCAPASDEARLAETTQFWDDQYGVNMSALAPLALRCAFGEPVVESVAPETLLSWPIPLRRIDCARLPAADVLPWTSGQFTASAMGAGQLTGLALWFDVEFGAPAGGDGGLTLGVGAPRRLPSADEPAVIRLSTGPDDPATHWMVTSLFLESPLEVRQDDVVRGSLSLQSHASNARFLRLSLSLAVAPAGGEDGQTATKVFDML